MAQVPELTPTAFLERWPDYAESVILLDVREPEEFEHAALGGTVRIPMREVPARLGELDRDKPIVVMCHSGRRSLLVAQYLDDSGFRNVFNLAGGIDAWARQIDGSVSRY